MIRRFSPVASGSLPLLLLFFFPLALSAQFNWEPFNDSLYGASISSMVFDSRGNLIVGTGHGIYRYEEYTGGEFDIPDWTRLDTTIRSPELVQAPGGTLYAMTTYGVYRSRNDGMSWDTLYAVPNPSYHVGPMAVLNDSSLIWRVNGELHVSWEWGRAGFQSRIHEKLKDREWKEIHVAPDSTIYVLDNLNRLISSRYYYVPGNPWGGELSGVMDVAILNSDTIIVADFNFVKRSTDRGRTWTTVFSHPLYSPIYSIVQGANGKLYGLGLRTEDPNLTYPLYISSDTGLTWIEDGSHYGGVCIAGTGEQLFQAVRGHLFHSSSAGSQWEELPVDIRNARISNLLYNRKHRSVYTTIVLDSVEYWVNSPYVIERQRLYRSDRSTGSWRLLRDTVSRMVGVDSVGNLYIQNDRILYYTDKSNELSSELLLSSDGGDTWRSVYATVGYDKPVFTVRSSSAGVIVVGIERNLFDPNYHRETVFVQLLSIDSGATWKEREDWLPDRLNRIQEFHVLDNGDILFSDFISPLPAAQQAECAVWNYHTGTGEITLLDTSYIGLMVSGGGGRIYSNRNRGLAVTTDRGVTWQSLGTPSTPFPMVNAMKVDLSGGIYIKGRAISDVIQDTVFYSPDEGETWHVMSQDFPVTASHRSRIPQLVHRDVLVDAAYYYYYDKPWLGRSSFPYLIWSMDNGISWQIDQGELRYKQMTTILLTDDGDLYVGTREDGVYRARGVLSVDEVKREEGLSHLRVFPAPSHERATILLRLDRFSHVRLELYDPLGRSIGLIADREFDAGEHSFPVDLRGLTSGSYFLRLTGENVKETVPVLIR